MISIPIRKSLSFALVFLIIIACQVSPIGSSSRADTRPSEDRGAMALGQAIKRLGVVGSVLHTGAHPDDEDSGLLAYLARGRQVRTAYLSLTRGDGGQNVIGPELYEALGVIRTDELLAARRLDGAQQFFSRAFDFGFSKSRTETLSKWDREAVLADMVRVIRTFRPLVIVSGFSGTPNDGHGHHQAAGLLTQEAYRVAADPSRFPEQIKEGLRPWQAKKLYLRSFDGAASPREFLPSLATLSLNTGEFDALLGCSYYEIAARGRSQHRSQDQGTIEARGPRFSRLRLIDSKLGPIKNEKDIFDDINTGLTAIAEYAGAAAPKLRERLAQVQSAADEAMVKYNPLARASVTEVIARGLMKLLEISNGLSALGLSESEILETNFLLQQKKGDFVDALLKSEGIIVDCLADDEIVTPGQTFTVTLSAFANSAAKLGRFGLVTPAGWTVVQKGKEKVTEVDGRLVLQAEYTVTASTDAEPTRPYWLNSARKGDMFAIEKPGEGATGIEPVSPAAIEAFVDFKIGEPSVRASQEVEYRYADRALGEIRHELKVAPAVSVNVSPDILVYPKSSTAVERQVTVSVTNNQKGGVRGSLALQKQSDWQVTPAISNFDLKREGERALFTFVLKAPAGSGETTHQVSAVATIDGRSYREGYQVVAYPHIGSRFVYHEARAQAEVIDVKVAPGLKVGYIEGAGDDFGAALERIGVDVKTIDSKELASGDLSVYDAIVAGIRVYEVRPDVIANNARLIEYVNRGGTYIVQYSRGNFETGGFAPYRTGREERQDARAQGPRDRQGDREPRLLYLSETELAPALASKSTAKPKIGFIGAAGDKVLDSLRSAGLDARPLSANELGGDLSQLDVIIVGSDASSKPELAEYNSRLLEYSRRKLVILAYSQAQFLSGDFPSYPKPEARPFRVTDELAAVTILEPNHPRFNFPNKITQRDFEGWVQERGAYFLGDWDPHFKPLMACHDPGEPDLKGGEVIAEYGKGLYVYTAYAWFRQLPKGVPGAYRLIANLVSLPKARNANSHTR
ncbi:MAG TPA: PIG-L family deacetylase [Blastocatellia bacterium]|nr:PIG-L family deacetylase [Blastocatellia bacterium]